MPMIEQKIQSDDLLIQIWLLNVTSLEKLYTVSLIALYLLALFYPPESLDSEGSSVPEPSHHLLSVCGNLRGDECWPIP